MGMLAKVRWTKQHKNKENLVGGSREISKKQIGGAETKKQKNSPMVLWSSVIRLDLGTSTVTGSSSLRGVGWSHVPLCLVLRSQFGDDPDIA